MRTRIYNKATQAAKRKVIFHAAWSAGDTVRFRNGRDGVPAVPNFDTANGE